MVSVLVMVTYEITGGELGSLETSTVGEGLGPLGTGATGEELGPLEMVWGGWIQLLGDT